MAADDKYLNPIYRTFQEGVVQSLLSALDHLRFLVWSLENRDEPYPYGQATLIRTAITGASTALWMLSGSTADERRVRALESNFKDLKSYQTWIDTVKAEPKNQTLSAADQAKVDAERVEIDRRLDWIVQSANTLLVPPRPFTRGNFGNRTTDTDLVRTAGAAIPPTAMAGFDPAISLLGTWQSLSGYAHARPWATVPGRVVLDTDPTANMMTVTQKGDPDTLLSMRRFAHWLL
jgi:hypothetical protein